MDELVAKTWHKIQQEAQCMAAQEPMLASFFHSTILNHKNLRSALSFQLANKLDSATMPAIALREVIELALRSEPELLAVVAADICAVQERDPAVDLFSTPLLYLKGFHALQGYRVANWLWRQGRRSLALYLQNQISVVFGVDVHPAARIGKG
ncbi:serine O-acetyltransferase, partial [Aeromonas caviae]